MATKSSMAQFIKGLEQDYEKARALTGNARQELRKLEAKVAACEERENALRDTLDKARAAGSRKVPAKRKATTADPHTHTVGEVGE